MAANFAGKNFAPVSQGYLSRALKQYGPEKIGNDLIIDQGQVIGVPGAGRNEGLGVIQDIGRQSWADQRSLNEQARADARAAANRNAENVGTWKEVEDPNTGQIVLFNNRTMEVKPLPSLPGAAPIRAPSANQSPGFNIPKGRPSNLTADQDKSRFIATNMAQAIPDIVNVLSAGYEPNKDDFAAMSVPSAKWSETLRSKYTSDMNASPQGRTFIKSGKKLLAGVLRKESGGAITDDEWIQYGPVYLPWPGDSKEERESKVRALVDVTNNMAMSTGPAQRYWNQIPQPSLYGKRNDRGETVLPPPPPPSNP